MRLMRDASSYSVYSVRSGLVGLVGLVLWVGPLAGCAAPPMLGAEAERARLATLSYPAEAEYGPDLDIVVRREGKQLVLINRTARTYRDVRVWLNQQYVREVTQINIGPNHPVNLTRWGNLYREAFPVGTLLTPDAAFPVVLAELVDLGTGLRHRLLVWPDDTTP